jgi:tetratricopeptide (TPR) repeat protein
MKKLLLICLLVPGTISWGASIKPSEQELSTFMKAVDYVFQDSFPQALQLADGLTDTFPGQPVRHLLYASILHAQMLDSEDYSKESEFKKNLDAALDCLNDWVDHHPDDAWGLFFCGSSYGYKAIWLAQKGSSLKAMFAGLKAKSRFLDAVKIDPRFYDCYTGIGSYHYWSSVKLRKFLPFLPDNRDDGLRELYLAADSSYVSAKPAAVGLAWALLNEKNYKEAFKIANQLKEATNSGRSVLWVLGGVYWSNGNLRKSAQIYGELIESLERAGNQNGYNLIYLHYRKGVCYFGMGNNKAAEKEFNTILSYNPSKEIRKRHEDTFKKSREYLDRIAKAKK